MLVPQERACNGEFS